MLWTFETRYLGSEWLISGQRFKTVNEAGDAMREWAIVSAQNGVMAECRLKEVVE